MTKDKSVIPYGDYCYSILEEPCEKNNWKIKAKICPYWSLQEGPEDGNNGYCSFLEKGDWETFSVGLLWDQVKECGINTYDDENMSIHDEIWDKCDFCGETLKTFNRQSHGPGKCDQKELKSLEEFNLEKLNSLPFKYKTGIKCPECEVERELVFENPQAILPSDPPKREVRCIFCGYSGYILA